MTAGAKIGLVFGGLLVLTCGIGGVLVLQWADYPTASAELPRAVDEARAAGVPMTSAELWPAWSVPDKDNAASGFEALATTFESGSASSKRFADLYAGIGRGEFDWPEAERTVAANRRLLNELRTLSRKPVLDLHRDWDVGPDLLFPELARAKSAVKVLCVSALALAHQGRYSEAGADLMAARRLGALCSQEPTLISLLVQVSVDAIVFRVAEEMLAELPAAAPALLKSVLAQEPKYDLRRALRGEAFIGVTVARNMGRFGGLKGLSASSSGSGSTGANPASLQRSGLPSGMVQRAYMTRTLQFWTTCFRTMDAHPGDNVFLADALDKAANEAQSSRRLSQLLNTILLPVFGDAGRVTVKGVADYRCKRALALAFDWSRAHHGFPASLTEARVDLTDPFDGKPLRYRSEGGTVRIWSVGPNRKDDGGVARAELTTAKKDDFDVVASYPPVRSRN